MKITKWVLSAAIAASCLGGSAVQAQQYAGSYSQAAAPVVAAPVVSASQMNDYSNVIPASCGCGDAPVSSCDTGCTTSYCDAAPADMCGGGCDAGSCDSAGCGCGSCGGGLGGALGGGAGLAGLLGGIDVGGWVSLGHHTYNNTLFNQHADRVRLHQAWVYAEKVADGSNGIGLGGRIDYLYGVDAQDTQAFGIPNGHWDTNWVNGIYGHAMPQLYGEVAIGDLSVIVGHFYTLIGYEVVGAPGNFFYSHAYTMYNSEPFTHTGALATYSASDALTLYGGYVLGWDSGFEDNGDAFLGGYSVDLADNFNITNQVVAGRFSEQADGTSLSGEVGFMTSWIATTTLSDALTHVFWIDYLDTDHGYDRATRRETFDITNYLLVSLTDNLTWGNRLEWYNIDDLAGGHNDVYEFTTGFNLGLGENLMIRPEVRWDWDKDNVIGNELGSSQTTAGGDVVFSF